MKSFRFKRTQRKDKTPYRIGNWRAYEAGLRQREAVTVWITADAKKAWCHRGRRKPCGKGVYSDVAIETFWMNSMIYGLALRRTEGFIESLFELACVTLPVADHSTVSGTQQRRPGARRNARQATRRGGRQLR